MQIEQVPRWVMTALMMTTALIFASGLSLLLLGALPAAAGWYLVQGR